MCKYCEYGRYESDDRPCCEECYLNRQSVFGWICIESAISYLEFALSFITIREGNECLV